MNLTEDEKKVIRLVLKKHLEEVKQTEGDTNQDLVSLAKEVKYEDFVKNIIKKL